MTAALHDVVGEYLGRAVPQGERNRSLYVAACAAYRQGGDEQDIFSRLSSKAMSDGLKGMEIQATIKSALKSARADGRPRPRADRIVVWNAALPYGVKEAKKHEIPGLAEDWEYSDFCKFLSALFFEGEFVSYNTTIKRMEDGKAVPSGWGEYKKTTGELIAAFQDARVADVLNATDQGAWIRLNAMDGQGIKDENVAAFRHCLVESDTLPIQEQWNIVNRLRLPVSTCVHSGNKSLHFAVKIQARDRAEYDSRVSLLYAHLEAAGMKIDTQNRNPSRLSRMPGVFRGEKPQYLVAENFGCASWQEFEQTLPKPDASVEIEPLVRSDVKWLTSPAPVLNYVFDRLVPAGIVCGLFAQGGTGKGWLVETLILSLTIGLPILPSFRPSRKARVLWLESEDPPEELHRRGKRLQRAHGLSEEMGPTVRENLHLFAGQAFPLCETLGKTVTRTPRYREVEAIVRDVQPALIVVDPFSHFFAGDENSNTEVSAYMNYLRDLTKLSDNCSLWLNHHVPKGKELSLESGAGRGASALRDAIRVAFNLVALTPEELTAYNIDTPHLFVKLAMSKANYTERADTLVYLRRDTGSTGGVLREVDLPAIVAARAAVDSENLESALFVVLGTHDVTRAELGGNLAKGKGYDTGRAVRELIIDRVNRPVSLKEFKALTTRLLASGRLTQVPGDGSRLRLCPADNAEVF